MLKKKLFGKERLGKITAVQANPPWNEGVFEAEEGEVFTSVGERFENIDAFRTFRREFRPVTGKKDIYSVSVDGAQIEVHRTSQGEVFHQDRGHTHLYGSLQEMRFERLTEQVNRAARPRNLVQQSVAEHNQQEDARRPASKWQKLCASL